MITAMPHLLGNEGLRKTLCDHVRAGDLAHAYILSGVRGSGKHTAARALAAALACESAESASALPCGTCLSCRKILADKSPDVIFVRREGASLGVDAIRFLRTDAVVIPNDLEYKIYIIEDAHTMTRQAQNAFLLTLEEPPKYVLFLLLCESTEPLLETIKSRAPILRMRPLTREVFSSHWREQAAAGKLPARTPDELDELYVISGGYLGPALELGDPKQFGPIAKARQLVTDFLTAYLSPHGRERLVELVGEFPQKRDELCEQLRLAEDAVRDLILLKKADEVETRFFGSVEKAAELSSGISLPALLTLFDELERAIDALSRNANVRLTMIHLISNLC